MELCIILIQRRLLIIIIAVTVSNTNRQIFPNKYHNNLQAIINQQ